MLPLQMATLKSREYAIQLDKDLDNNSEARLISGHINETSYENKSWPGLGCFLAVLERLWAGLGTFSLEYWRGNNILKSRIETVAAGLKAGVHYTRSATRRDFNGTRSAIETRVVNGRYSWFNLA